MKVLIIVDKDGTAIDRLAHMLVDYNEHHVVRVKAVHPRTPMTDPMTKVVTQWKWCDVVHISYWKSGERFKEQYPKLWASKQKVLWHHNPYDLEKLPWKNDYVRVVVHNKYMLSKIPYADFIPQGVDIDYFDFNENYTENKTVNMVVGRIEANKGVLEVAKACAILGYRFILVGRISKRTYFGEIMRCNKDVEFHENVTDERLRELYYQSAIHVCNSKDNFESGTMPIMEAMACGVPVLTRNIGHVPDMNNGKNMAVRLGNYTDVDDLVEEIRALMENRERRLDIREHAWTTVRQRTSRTMARRWSTVYHKVRSRMPLVSVIVPTMGEIKILHKCLEKLARQDYPNIEVIVAHTYMGSRLPPDVRTLIKDYLERITVKYIPVRRYNENDYTLPRARNLAVVESEGHFVALCDQRIGMDSKAISSFVAAHSDFNQWMFGVKDGFIKGFVENFSLIQREALIQYGMFNERIDSYGGASQELRERFRRNGVAFIRVDAAQATAIESTTWNQAKKRQSIRHSKEVVQKLYDVAR